MMRQNNVEVSQSVANEMSASFSKRKFHDALIDWVASDNQSLRVIETPSFLSMIKAANLLAESVLWRNHQSLRDTIVAEYHAFIPVVTAYLRSARSLIHVSFDNWTSTGGKLGLTGICVHMMDTHGIVQDFALGLPELHGQHSGVNIADVVATALTNFGVDKDSVGYFAYLPTIKPIASLQGKPRGSLTFMQSKPTAPILACKSIQRSKIVW
jgi:hypothetical protein